MTSQSPLVKLIGPFTRAEGHEAKATALAFALNFVLFASYYILRPLRDTMATVFGVSQLQNLFTGTFLITLALAPVFAWVTSKITLARFLPGVFWFLFLNLCIFFVLFRLLPQNRWVAGSYYCWFSTINLFLVSVFWTLMADTFSPAQATRLYAFIATGAPIGAILGPVITASFVKKIGISGLLLIAIAGFLIVIVLVHLVMSEKKKLRQMGEETQPTTLDHALPGNPLKGFSLLFRSPYLMGQAAFFLFMTWIATILYFLQAEFISRTYSAIANRTIAFADVDLFVNVCSAIVLVFGLGRMLRRYGVTPSLVLTPIIMVAACLALLIAPVFFAVQSARALQRITQYAIARPSREVLFTVLDQQSKYKAKNVIDTSVYRFGDLTAAWMQAGLRSLGFGFAGVVTMGVSVSIIWGIVAFALGRRYEAIVGSKTPQSLPIVAK